MNQTKCILCGFSCEKYGKTKAGTQRWHCKLCNCTFTRKIDMTGRYLEEFLCWLFSKRVQQDMPGKGRTFRRHSFEFWNIWPMPPIIESSSDVLYIDGIYLSRKACILICYDGQYVLGWYLCRYEQARSWIALMQRIAAPIVVVSDGGTGFRKALKSLWKSTKLQRCIFHAFCQVKRYTTSRPKTVAGIELYGLAQTLLHINTSEEAAQWISNIHHWRHVHRIFLAEMTKDAYGNLHSTHKRLLKAYKSLEVLIHSGTLFTYLDASLPLEEACPRTNNSIEGGVNGQLRALLRNHRGMSIERRIKAVFWWCYMHSPKPLSASEILKVMPTDKSISTLYNTMNQVNRLEGIIPAWGDAVVWSDLHNYDTNYFHEWD